MKITDFAGKKVLVMGLGIHGGGLGVANFFLKMGAQVTVTDLKDKSQLSSALQKLVGKPKLVLGRHRKKDFQTADLVVRNPAVPADSEFLKLAREKGVPVEMESSLFFQLSPTTQIIGVTGTKGKTTTTLLIGHILQKAKKKAVIGGNLQISMLKLLPKIKKDSWVVLELSSWQLEGLVLHSLSPKLAVLTNLFEDHLNRYSSFADYVEAKKLIFKFQKPTDYFVTNGNQDLTKKIAIQAKSQIRFFSAGDLPSQVIAASQLPGKHNQENVACAFEVVKILGISQDQIVYALKTFRPLADRLEEVAIIDGVRFINDTTATTPAATIAALDAINGPAILICGGADKNLNFDQMTKVVNQRAKKVVLLEGTATEKIFNLLKREKIIGRFGNFKEAVENAKASAKPFDVILLSPGCASFGMFENEFDRGEQFRQIVHKLEKRTS